MLEELLQPLMALISYWVWDHPFTLLGSFASPPTNPDSSRLFDSRQVSLEINLSSRHRKRILWLHEGFHETRRDDFPLQYLCLLFFCCNFVAENLKYTVELKSKNILALFSILTGSLLVSHKYNVTRNILHTAHYDRRISFSS